MRWAGRRHLLLTALCPFHCPHLPLPSLCHPRAAEPGAGLSLGQFHGARGEAGSSSLLVRPHFAWASAGPEQEGVVWWSPAEASPRSGLRRRCPAVLSRVAQRDCERSEGRCRSSLGVRGRYVPPWCATGEKHSVQFTRPVYGGFRDGDDHETAPALETGVTTRRPLPWRRG